MAAVIHEECKNLSHAGVKMESFLSSAVDVFVLARQNFSSRKRGGKWENVERERK